MEILLVVYLIVVALCIPQIYLISKASGDTRGIFLWGVVASFVPLLNCVLLYLASYDCLYTMYLKPWLQQEL